MTHTSTTEDLLRGVWLVQRMEERNPERADGKGVDRYFSMDYMGSSEFEYGALPSTLRALRADPTMKKWAPVKVTADLPAAPGQKFRRCEAWAVCRPEQLEVVRAFFARELAPHGKRTLKEGSRIDAVYRGETFARATGWWCVDSDGGWALFTTESQAEKWLRGLRG